MKPLPLISLLCTAPGIATAQSALENALSDTFAPVALTEALSDSLTCTAAYRSVTLVLGEQSEFTPQFREREGFMASFSGLLWAEEAARDGQTGEQVFDILLPPINAATDIYLARMTELLAETDAPFDDEIMGQIEYCNAIHTFFQEQNE